jgi:hypothetical protein
MPLHTVSANSCYHTPEQFLLLDAVHAARKQQKVKISQIRLFIPRHLVLLDCASEDGVRTLCMA